MTPYFITAIDTDTGKTLVTGLLAAFLQSQNKKVITFKIAQTGCKGISEDILMHRKIQKKPLLPEDLKGLTCPYVFPFPASPHLAARMEGQSIKIDKIESHIKRLSEKFPYLLLEGVGGLCVPLNEEQTLLDFLKKHRFPTFVVTSGKLGSINHTLLTLNALKNAGIPIAGILYNEYPLTDPQISKESKRLFASWDAHVPLCSIPILDPDHFSFKEMPDFSRLFV